MDGLIFILLLLIFSGLLYFFYRSYEKEGISVFLVIAVVLSFVLSLKIGKITSFDTILYAPVYMAIFIAFYVLLEKGNSKDIKKCLYLSGFVCLVMIFMFIFSYLYLPIISNGIAINIKKLFVNNWVNILVFPILLVINVLASIYLYKYTKKYYDHIFVNSCFAAIVVQLIDSLVLGFLSLYNILDVTNIFRISLMTYSFKLMANILYIPVFYYVLKYRRPKQWMNFYYLER